MDDHQIAGELAQITVQLKALRGDIDSLRTEMRTENARLRGDIATAMSRQNSAIKDAKKKRTGLPRLSRNYSID